MATAKSSSARRLDLNAALNGMKAQFRGLDPRDPGRWPILPKVACWLAVFLLSLVAAWFAVLSAEVEALDRDQQREQALKREFQLKLSQAINLGELRRQKVQVQEYVTQLEQQLPGKAEMDALLSDINQAGLGRGLVFELFRPGAIQLRDYYAELPIALKVTGRYHDVGAFAAEIANLPRIVTLHDLSLSVLPNSVREGARESAPVLTMDATARTYRYLDPSEIKPPAKGAPAKGAPK